jgi:predicted GIY-YIG superfamily endonuclease
MRTHALYRFFDAGSDLLYVGVTNDPGRRWGQHANDKPWWHEVDHIEIERYPDRESVLAAERKAIQEEHPRYNVVHAPVPAVPTLVEDRPRPGVCECGDPATVLYVLYRDIAEHESDMKAWAARQSGITIDIFSMPEPIHWTAACDRHLPEEGGPYEIPYPDTWKAWAARTAHLLEKEWLPKTNWSVRLYDAGCAGRENLIERKNP